MKIHRIFANLKAYICTAITIILLSSNTTLALSRIDINSGNMQAIPTAINSFLAASSSDTKLGKELIYVITQDLANSGVFRPISKSAFIENKIGVEHTPLFASWQQINASLLLNGSIERLSGDKIKVNFILWDNFIEKQMLAESFELPAKSWRRVAHKIADSVYTKITGYPGYFDSQIVYVAESGPYLKRTKRIALMDQDGANHQYLTDGKDLVLTPRFSPDGKKILFLSYSKGTPQVYQMDLKTKRSKLIGNFPGMSFAPRFAPDSKHAVMSIAKRGTTHIYEINLDNKKLKQLTFGDNINTSPSYSPDGEQIVFNSNRYGSRQLFTMDKNGGNVKRISYSGGSYSEPSWSSSNYISFTKTSRDHGFTIGVMRPTSTPDKNTERLLANGYLVESSSWFNNGRLLVFTRGVKPDKNGKAPSSSKGLHRIYSIDFTGYNERIIPTPSDASDADCSRLRD